MKQSKGKQSKGKDMAGKGREGKGIEWKGREGKQRAAQDSAMHEHCIGSANLPFFKPSDDTGASLGVSVWTPETHMNTGSCIKCIFSHHPLKKTRP